MQDKRGIKLSGDCYRSKENMKKLLILLFLMILELTYLYHFIFSILQKTDLLAFLVSLAIAVPLAAFLSLKFYPRLRRFFDWLLEDI